MKNIDCACKDRSHMISVCKDHGLISFFVSCEKNFVSRKFLDILSLDENEPVLSLKNRHEIFIAAVERLSEGIDTFEKRIVAATKILALGTIDNIECEFMIDSENKKMIIDELSNM